MSNRSTTLVMTPNVMRIREFMDRALNCVDGLEFRFLASRHGSLAAAKSRAVSLQNQVASIRARARNTKQLQINRKNLEFIGEQVLGPYDKIVVAKYLMENDEGWKVVIGAASSIEEFEIYDAGTGERILEFDPRIQRRDALGMYFLTHLKGTREGQSPLSDEQARELHSLDADYFLRMYEGTQTVLPEWLGTPPAPPELIGSDVDDVETAIEDFGVGVDGDE